MPMDRREYIRRLGATATVGVVGLGATTGTALAASLDARTPEFVTLSYDEGTLNKYRPRLVLRDVDRKKLLGMHGLVARSPDYDTTMLVYWTEWSHQTGVSDSDSHLGDHEPFYVEIDEQAGEMQRVIYSAYHWLAGRSTAPTTDGSSHPTAVVVSPWHQYSLTAEVGDLLDVGDLTAELPSWLDNGLDDALHPGAVGEPWTMKSRESWWRRGRLGVSRAELFWSVAYDLGIGGAGASDDPVSE